jgi:hypothetical protein
MNWLKNSTPGMGQLFCRDLLGRDIINPDDMQRAADKKLFFTACSRFVRDAAEILKNCSNISRGRNKEL